MNYPKIYLVLDNCFAIKRWVEPETWGPLIKQLGFDYVEASFDNEADFFYSPDWYLDAWFDRVKAVEAAQDIHVANFFTGYQTYRTAGLAHPNEKMARHMLEGWVKPAIERLGARGSGIGFSLHAYPDRVLQDPELYKKETRKVSELLSEIGGIAKDNGNIPVCVEAMYAPHQTPWTIEGTKNFLRDIYNIGQNPVYTTIDMGHMVGQVRFQKPSRDAVRKSIEAAIEGRVFTEPWLGGDTTYAIWEKAIKDKDTGDGILDPLRPTWRAILTFSPLIRQILTRMPGLRRWPAIPPLCICSRLTALRPPTRPSQRTTTPRASSTAPGSLRPSQNPMKRKIRPCRQRLRPST